MNKKTVKQLMPASLSPDGYFFGHYNAPESGGVQFARVIGWAVISRDGEDDTVDAVVIKNGTVGFALDYHWPACIIPESEVETYKD